MAHRNSVTRREVNSRVERMQRAGMPIELDYAFGRPRIVSKGGKRYLSSRLPTSGILAWLEAYEEGWEAGHTNGVTA